MILTSFVEPSTKWTLKKKIVLLSSCYITTTFFFFPLMSRWKTCTARCKTNRACNRKMDKILVKNPPQKSSTFKGDEIGTVSVACHSLKRQYYLYTTKPPGKIIHTILNKTKQPLSYFLFFLFGRKMCLSIPISYPESMFTTFLEFRHLKEFLIHYGSERLLSGTAAY